MGGTPSGFPSLSSSLVKCADRSANFLTEEAARVYRKTPSLPRLWTNVCVHSRRAGVFCEPGVPERPQPLLGLLRDASTRAGGFVPRRPLVKEAVTFPDLGLQRTP